MMRWKTGLVFGGAIVVGVASMWAFIRGERVPSKPGDEGYHLAQNKRVSAKTDKVCGVAKSRGKRVAQAMGARKAPPQFEIGLDEEAKLTAVQAKLLAEIRAALKAENKKEIIRLIRRLQAMDEWPDGIPMAVKKASLQALGWCGASALPELLGFLGDADKSVVSEATSYWEDAIAECDHDVDRMVDGVLEEGLATHVKNAAKIINDAESMESVLDEITSGMRHSVAVETIKDILMNGNDLAREKVLSVIEDMTDDETIRTAEQLDAWYDQKDSNGEYPNHDDPDDKYMYGGEDDSSVD